MALNKETKPKIDTLVGCVLLHINPCGLFNAKSYLCIYIRYMILNEYFVIAIFNRTS